MTFLRWAKLFEIEIFFEYLQQFYLSFYNVRNYLKLNIYFLHIYNNFINALSKVMKFNLYYIKTKHFFMEIIIYTFKHLYL
jgi:hypothetical protein